MSEDTTETESPDDTIAADWADEYEAGTELFCATFEADDFDPEYGADYPGGTTIAVRRFLRRPSPGWIRRHAHLSDMVRVLVLLEHHSSAKALAILDSLTEQAWRHFTDAWAEDGGDESPRPW